MGRTAERKTERRKQLALAWDDFEPLVSALFGSEFAAQIGAIVKPLP